MQVIIEELDLEDTDTDVGNDDEEEEDEDMNQDGFEDNFVYFRCD